MYKKFYFKRKLVGIYDNGIFYKEVTDSLHRMRVLNSWGIDAKVFHQLPEKCIIRIHDIEFDKTYVATKEHYLANQVYKHIKTEKHDFGAQIFLPLTKFTVEELTEDEKVHQEYKKYL